MLKRLMEKLIFYNKAFIYRVYDQRNISMSFYIGKTTRTLEKRLSEHIIERNRKSKNRRPISDFISCLIKDKVLPSIEVIQEYKNISLYDLNNWERYFIRWFKGYNYNLLNATDGGDGRSNYLASDESRKKMSIARKGRKHTKDTKIKMSKTWLGKKRGPWPEERKLQKSIQNIGEGNPMAKLTIENVKEIKQHISNGISQHKLASMFNISRSVISNISIGRIWKSVK